MNKGTPTNQKFLYADKKQQLIRANRFLAIGYVVYYVYVMLMLFTSLMRNERSLGFCGMVGIFVLISLTFILVTVKKDPASVKLKYIALIGLSLLAGLSVTPIHRTLPAFWVHFL